MTWDLEKDYQLSIFIFYLMKQETNNSRSIEICSNIKNIIKYNSEGSPKEFLLRFAEDKADLDSYLDHLVNWLQIHNKHLCS